MTTMKIDFKGLKRSNKSIIGSKRLKLSLSSNSWFMGRSIDD